MMLKEKSNNPPSTAMNAESYKDSKLGKASLLVQESHAWGHQPLSDWT